VRALGPISCAIAVACASRQVDQHGGLCWIRDLIWGLMRADSLPFALLLLPTYKAGGNPGLCVVIVSQSFSLGGL